MPHRVLFMISSMRGGGSERQTLLLLRHLDRRRFTPYLYLIERAGDLLSELPEDVIVESFDDDPGRGGMYFPGRVMRQQIAHLRKLLVRHQIDVIYDRTFNMTMIASPAGRSAGVPCMSTIVSPPEHALPLVESRFVAFKRRRLANAYRRSRAVIAVSRQAADSAERYYGLPRNTVEVIPNAVDVAGLSQAAAEITPSRDDRLTLVCVGRMSEEKGHRDLIEAVIQGPSRGDLPSLRLWMVGDGPLRSELETRSSRAADRHTVEFLGTQRNPAPWIAAADGLVLPSHFEGMPNVVLEAMALGTPVIATRSGGTVELERNQPTVLWADPQTPRSLAEAIARLSQDPSAALQRAANARALIRDHHDVGLALRRVEDRLEAVCRR